LPAQRSAGITLSKGKEKKMYRIVEKKRLNSAMCRLTIHAPDIARKALPGQFVIVRIHENGERIPLTVYKNDAEKGTVTIIVLEVGKTTEELCRLSGGDELLDFVGPLGRPTRIEKFGTVVCIGGGVGAAEIAPVARALKERGNRVISIIGFRAAELVILEDEMKEISDRLYVTTDDGSYGTKGFTTAVLEELLKKEEIDIVFAVGPLPMMKAAAEVTRPHKIKTIVSLNSIMVDGTGMCGCCRVIVGGETKFACVDGPEFDAHQVDFANLELRRDQYREEEQKSLKQFRKKCGGSCRKNGALIKKG
jgi:ferredoxin--NADP+ reductase